MYEDYEGQSSLPLALKGLFAIVIIGAIIYCLFLFVTKLKQRKLKFTISDILKLIWMIASVVILIFMVSLFFPEFSVEEANRKFSELLPFKKGFLGATTALIAAFLVTIFCVAGIGTYFENPKKIENNQHDN
jgi:cation transport ATPase